MRIRAALCAAAAILALVVAYRVIETPFWDFNGARLVPSFLLASGHNVFELPGRGPMYSVIYGPVTYLFYLPATIFRTPNSSVLAASLMTVLACFGAVAALHFTPARRRAGGFTALAGFMAAGMLICLLEPLRYSCIRVHADGPGLAFGGMACAVLMWNRERLSWRSLTLSALFTVAAIFAKQLFVGLAFGIAAYLAIAHGWRVARIYVLAAGLIGGAAALASVAAFGGAELYYNLIWIPGHQPWKYSPPVALIQSLRFFDHQLLAVLLLLAVFLVLLAPGARLRSLRAALRDADWSLPIVAGLALLPFSLAGLSKVGGDVNSLSFASFFLVNGLTCMLVDVFSGHASADARRLSMAALASIILLGAATEGPIALDLPRKWKSLPQAEQQVAFEFARSHPGRMYFPLFPQSHYLGEGRFYNTMTGINDRLMAGEKVGPERLAGFMPAGEPAVALGAKPPGEFAYVVGLLPGRLCAVEDPMLPGWNVFAPSDAPNCRLAGGDNTYVTYSGSSWLFSTGKRLSTRPK